MTTSDATTNHSREFEPAKLAGLVSVLVTSRLFKARDLVIPDEAEVPAGGLPSTGRDAPAIGAT